MSRILQAHAEQRAVALFRQASDEQAFADTLARDRQPKERQLLVEVRFRVRHLRRLAGLWWAFAEGATS